MTTNRSNCFSSSGRALVERGGNVTIRNDVGHLGGLADGQLAVGGVIGRLEVVPTINRRTISSSANLWTDFFFFSL